MLASIKLVTLAASFVLTSFQGAQARDAAFAVPVNTNGEVTEYALEEGGAHVLASWKAKSASPRAIILAVHGFGLYKYAFKSFAEEMSENGVSTYALDIRGFGEWSHGGKSDRKLNLQQALKDIHSTLAELKEENPNTPIFLLGESMGGALALRAASDSPELVAGVISSVPSGKLVKRKTLAAELAVKFVLRAGSKIDISKHVLCRATGDKNQIRQWLDDGNVRLKVSKSELWQFANFMNGNDKVARSLKSTPVLMIQGAQDRLIQPSGTVRIYNELASEDKSMVLLNDGEHLVFEERQIDRQILADLTQWIDTHSTSAGELVAINH